MTQQDENGTTDRLAAHERLSTGALARWMRACADASVARRLQLGRHHRDADRPRRHDRRLA